MGALYRNEALLQRYLTSRRLGLKTRLNYQTAIRCFSDLVGIPLEEAGRADLDEWYRRANARGLLASTIALYAENLGVLLEFALMGRGLSRREARDRADDIMEGIPVTDLRREAERRRRLRDMIVSDEEFDALMEAAKHPRVRALVAILRESACRKGEVLNLRIRDVSHLDDYSEIRVWGKTGERTIPLVRSDPHLRTWLEAHPAPRPMAPMFVAPFGGEIRRIDRVTPNHILKDLCERAGTRHIYPLMLRHTRLTELARAGLGEYQLKSFAGWAPNSKMAARYIHFVGRAHMDAVLRVEGVKEG